MSLSFASLVLPGHEELAMGAIASGGVRVLNDQIIESLQLPRETIEAVTRQEFIELQRREKFYREHRPSLELQGRTAIVVDDGLATGSTMRAAVAAVRQLQAARIVVAVPVASLDTYTQFDSEVDEIVCPLTPTGFRAVGQWYARFDQTTDDEVRRLLDAHEAR